MHVKSIVLALMLFAVTVTQVASAPAPASIIRPAKPQIKPADCLVQGNLPFQGYCFSAVAYLDVPPPTCKPREAVCSASGRQTLTCLFHVALLRSHLPARFIFLSVCLCDPLLFLCVTILSRFLCPSARVAILTSFLLVFLLFSSFFFSSSPHTPFPSFQPILSFTQQLQWPLTSCA
ncbi:MAG: hypothetical protein JOS17DRAFT_565608 [Linnemannia elongata]|nr:MAG: hypothetical protein JOS17DRAFT_565608 [Linnemannia elongata]